ncbi:hypothetical protein ABZ897_59960 [Nonomuraea sp. NPDC046802]|uniref:hypothetical protein n=1 Tax=Nonomuraea sp. NPDC046802 TaxID=3154919 RepID=UPI0033F23B86
MTTPPVQNLTPAEQARALLADAARTNRFYTPHSWTDDNRQVLRENDGATAMYAAQAATAHAVLEVVGELRALREAVRHVLAVRNELFEARRDLADIASAVRGLTDVMTSGAAQTVDVANQLAELTSVVDRGQIDVAREVAAVAAAVDDHGSRRGWWSRLLRRRPAGPARPSVDDEMRSLPPLDTVPPVVPAISAGQCALERLAHLREVLADWAVTLPDSPNVSGLRQGLAVTVYEAWEATRAVIAQVVGGLPLGTSVSGGVQDAVLLLEAALHKMGPAGVPSVEAVQAVSDRLTELLKVVAAEAVAARAEVDAR